MAVQGRILRDTSQGTGILSIDGHQHKFTLEDHWRSDVLPVAGMPVDVSFDENGAVEIVRELAPVLPPKKVGGGYAGSVLEDSKKGFETLLGRIDKPAIAGFVVLVVAWFYLPFFSVSLIITTVDISFWKLLSFLDISGVQDILGHIRGDQLNAYSLLGIVAVLGPLLPLVWKDRRAALAATLPLLVMVAAGILLYSKISALSDMSKSVSDGSVGGTLLSGAMGLTGKMLLDSISIGFGTFLAVISSLYLAVHGVRRFSSQAQGQSLT